jgi:hypothetical protein
MFWKLLNNIIFLKIRQYLPLHLCPKDSKHSRTPNSQIGNSSQECFLITPLMCSCFFVALVCFYHVSSLFCPSFGCEPKVKVTTFGFLVLVWNKIFHVKSLEAFHKFHWLLSRWRHHHKLLGPWFGNNSFVKSFFFYTFILFKHGCCVFKTNTNHVQVGCKILL